MWLYWDGFVVYEIYSSYDVSKQVSWYKFPASNSLLMQLGCCRSFCQFRHRVALRVIFQHKLLIYRWKLQGLVIGGVEEAIPPPVEEKVIFEMKQID